MYSLQFRENIVESMQDWLMRLSKLWRYGKSVKMRGALSINKENIADLSSVDVLTVNSNSKQGDT